MKIDIAKQWADTLRTFSYNWEGIELKHSHAYEIVAAYFGYSSYAALLADAKCSVSNLEKAEFIVLQPSSFIAKRCRELNGVPEDLSLVLGGHTSPSFPGMTLNKTWPTLDFLALTLADEIIRAKYFFTKSKKFNVKVEPYQDGIYLKVLCEYSLLHSQSADRCIVSIFDLKRVAGHIGYIKSSHYSFEANSLELATKQMTSVKP